MTEGSRGTFSSGMATIFAAREAIGVLKQRAAAMWGIPVEDVAWEKGQAIAVGKTHNNPVSYTHLTLPTKVTV